MMKILAIEISRTGSRALMMITLALAGLFGAPSLELRYAPPVTLWEIHNPRAEDGGVSWSIVVHQVRACRSAIIWRADGVPISPRGPAALEMQPGEAAEIGPFHWPAPARVVSAEVRFNCGRPWGLAPIRKSAVVE